MLGAAALMFPLHLLVLSGIGLILTIAAVGAGIPLASVLFGLSTAATVILAVAPCVALWSLARREHVPLSLGQYLAAGLSPNRGGPRPSLSRSYATIDGQDLMLDVWRSRASANRPRPAIVKVHGGGWVLGERGEGPMWNEWLNQRGFDVFDVDYRLPPRATWRDEVADVKSAIGWVATHATELQIDPARISVWGMSAGGNLAMLAAYSMGDPRLPASTPEPAVKIRCVINLYGSSELERQHASGGSPDNESLAIRRYVGGSPEQFPDRYRLLSPIGHVDAKSPPTLTLLGASDRIVPIDQATLLDRALAAAGVVRETWLLPATDHAFDANWGGFATQFARARIEAFLNRHS